MAVRFAIYNICEGQTVFRVGAITDELSPDLDRALDMAREFGIPCVEIHSVWNKTVEQISVAEAKELSRRIRSRDLGVACLSSTIFLNCHLVPSDRLILGPTNFAAIEGPYEAHLAMLQRSLQIADVLRTPLVRVFGFSREGELDEERWRLLVNRFGEAIDLAEKAGMVLILENCPHTNLGSTSLVGKLLNSLKSAYIGVLWDPANAYASGETDYLTAFELIKRNVLHVHLKDVVIHEVTRNRRYVPIGQGEIDHQGVLRVLIASGYDGVVSLEPHHASMSGSIESAARASFRGLTRLLQEMDLPR